MKPDRSLTIIAVIVAGLLVIPTVLIAFFLSGARFPSLLTLGVTLLDVSLLVFWTWLLWAIRIAVELLRDPAKRASPLNSTLLGLGAFSSFGLLQAFSAWELFSLPVISAALLLWRVHQT